MRPLRSAAVASVLALAGAASAWVGSATETIDRMVKLPAGRQVVVVNLNGAVHVTAWDSPDVRLVAVKTARAATDGRARAYLRDLQVKVEESDGKLTIRTRTPGAEGGIKGWLTYTGVDEPPCGSRPSSTSGSACRRSSSRKASVTTGRNFEHL